MKATIKTLFRLAVAVALGAMTILPHTGISHAAGPRPMVASDFFALSGAAKWLPTPDQSVPAIAGAHFARGIFLDSGNSASFNSARFPGYAALMAEVGIADDSDTNATARLKITGDGKVLYSHAFGYAQLALRIVVPFGNTHAITISNDTCCGGQHLFLATPVLLPSGASTAPTTPSTSPGKITVQIFSATATAGGQQTALVATVKNALVTMVIDYPSGDQAVIGPKRAGPDGHYAYTWTLPSGIHGIVHVTVDSGGAVAQGSFTVS